MVKTADKPMEIEPLTKDEEKQRGITGMDVGNEHIADNPEYPPDWKTRVKELQSMEKDGGWKYHRRNQGGKTYMVLRKGKKDRGIGLWSEEREAKLFTFHPALGITQGITRPPPWTPQGTIQQRSFLSVPINRVAIIPRDYVPSISVIRYFQILKENGFPGDFSKFINDVVVRHFRVCNRVKLPVLIEEENVEVRSEGNVETTSG